MPFSLPIFPSETHHNHANCTGKLLGTRVTGYTRWCTQGMKTISIRSVLVPFTRTVVMSRPDRESRYGAYDPGNCLAQGLHPVGVIREHRLRRDHGSKYNPTIHPDCPGSLVSDKYSIVGKLPPKNNSKLR